MKIPFRRKKGGLRSLTPKKFPLSKVRLFYEINKVRRLSKKTSTLIERFEKMQDGVDFSKLSYRDKVNQLIKLRDQGVEIRKNLLIHLALLRNHYHSLRVDPERKTWTKAIHELNRRIDEDREDLRQTKQTIEAFNEAIQSLLDEGWKDWIDKKIRSS